MGASIPSGPSPQQAAYDAWLERERVRYQDQKRQFRERVGAYETLASDYSNRAAGSFEYDPSLSVMPTEGLMRQERFSPTFKPRDVNMNLITDPTQAYANTPGWFWAPSLGISKGTTVKPSEINQKTPTIHPMFGGRFGQTGSPIFPQKPPMVVDNYWTGRL